MIQDRESGFALLAAVAAVMVFGALSVQILSKERLLAGEVRARSDRARLEAAIDAATLMAAQGVASTDRARRWPIDGRPTNLTFNGVQMSVVIEDERGKVPLYLLDEDQVERMFSVAGASGDRLRAMTDAFNDWVDEDDERREFGAESGDYPNGIEPTGGFRTVGELTLLKGMDPDLVRRIAPFLTTNFGNSGSFSPRTSTPFAIAVLKDGGEDSVEAIEREREIAGGREALEIAQVENVYGRALTVRVRAHAGSGPVLERASMIELTGSPNEPVWFRATPGM